MIVIRMPNVSEQTIAKTDATTEQAPLMAQYQAAR